MRTLSEIWKEIPGLGGKYLLSSAGAIKNARTGHNICIFPPGTQCARASAQLYPDGSKQYVTVHIDDIMAQVFLDAPPKSVVYYIDGNLSNNDISNLSLIRPEEAFDSTEIWRPVPGYEDTYEVSNKGNFRSLRRKISHSRQGYNQRQQLLHTYDPKKFDYICVGLWRNGKCKQMLLHRLVAQVFIPNPGNKPYVNHIDGNRRNNCVENLEWCTPQENTQHAIRTGLQQKVWDNSVPIYCKELNMTFPTISATAKYLNITEGTVVNATKLGQPTSKGYTLIRLNKHGVR